MRRHLKVSNIPRSYAVKLPLIAEKRGESGFPLVYAVSLACSKTRTAFIRDSLAEAGLPYRIIYGTDGANPSSLIGVPCQPDLAEKHPGLVGCAWSHFRVAAEILKSGRPGIVIEDDAVLTSSYTEIAAAITDIPRDADLVLLHASSWEQATVASSGHTDLLWRVSQVSQGTQMYYLSVKGAEKVVKEMLPISDHVDMWFRSRSSWNTYQHKTGLAIHNHKNDSVRADSLIPKIFHTIWTGNNPVPENQQKWIKSWTDFNERNGYRSVHWGPIQLEQVFPEMWRKYRGANYALRSDIFRAAILFRFGGIYVDTDFECLRNIHEIFESSRASLYLGEEAEGVCSTGFLAAVTRSPFIADFLDEAEKGIATGMPMPLSSGPPALRRALLKTYPSFFDKKFRTKSPHGERAGNCFIIDRRLIYPYALGSEWRRESHPHAFAAHHWSASWVNKAK